MANPNGKKARKKTGTRNQARREMRHHNPTKAARWAERKEARMAEQKAAQR